MSDEESCCRNCRFWEHVGGEATPDGDGHGDCRLKPPVIVDRLINLHNDPERTETLWKATHFPVTWHEDCCGEFRHKSRML